jgi:glutamate 5-kinase
MRIVIKIGSNVLLGNKDALDLELMKKIVKEISCLHQKGYQIIIITSGAVAVGQIILKQADDFRSVAAAIGQPELTRHYADFFTDANIKIAQILLSPNSFKDRDRYDHLKKTLLKIINKHIIPVINENDVTILKDTFGDNDLLAAITAVIASVEKLVFLTNLDGLYSADPKINQNAQIIKQVKSIDLEIQKMCSKETSSLGRGGMLSKLKAAKLACTCGIEAYIINGLRPDNISKLLMRGQAIGTKFIAQQTDLSERKKWLLIGSVSQDKIIVDQGARQALENKNSLLAVGIRSIKGNFVKGDFVNIADEKGEVFAFGIVNYSLKELLPLNDLRDKMQIREKYKKEIVHIDNLTLLK